LDNNKKTGDDLDVTLNNLTSGNYKNVVATIKYGKDKSVNASIDNFTVVGAETVQKQGEENKFHQTGANEGTITLNTSILNGDKVKDKFNITKVSVTSENNVTANLVGSANIGEDFKVKLSNLTAGRNSGLKMTVTVNNGEYNIESTVNLSDCEIKGATEPKITVIDQFEQIGQNKGTIKLKVDVKQA